MGVCSGIRLLKGVFLLGRTQSYDMPLVEAEDRCIDGENALSRAATAMIPVFI